MFAYRADEAFGQRFALVFVTADLATPHRLIRLFRLGFGLDVRLVIRVRARRAGGQNFGVRNLAEKQRVRGQLHGVGHAAFEHRVGVYAVQREQTVARALRRGESGELICGRARLKAEASEHVERRVFAEHRNVEHSGARDHAVGVVRPVHSHDDRQRIARHLHDGVYDAAAVLLTLSGGKHVKAVAYIEKRFGIHIFPLLIFYNRLQFDARFERAGQRHLVGVFYIAAHAYTLRKPRDFYAQRLDKARDVHGGRFALHVGIGCEYDLFHSVQPRQQFLDPYIVGAPPFERRDSAVQHVIYAVEGVRFLHGGDVLGIRHHAYHVGRAFAADVADVALGEVAALFAVPDVMLDVKHSFAELLDVRLGHADNGVCVAHRRFRAHSGQRGKLMSQFVDGISHLHLLRGTTVRLRRAQFADAPAGSFAFFRVKSPSSP